jgi:hypothetical protein
MVGDETIVGTIQQIVGVENATSDVEDRIAYAKDQNWPFVKPQKPDFVVKVHDKKEVREIVRLANRYKMPLIPLAAGINVRGLCIPTQGGIVMDMREMDKILEMNPEMRTATIQPGVRSGQLVLACEKYGLRPAVTSAPDMVSAFANYLLRGLYHTQSSDGVNHILSMEIVLPSGEILKTGSAGITGSAGPYGMAGGPDLTGLFQGVPGAFGVVTEMTVRLYPYPIHNSMVIYAYDTWEPAVEATTKLMDLGVAAQIDMLDNNIMQTFMAPLGAAVKGIAKAIPKVIVMCMLQDQIKERMDVNKSVADATFKEVGGGMSFGMLGGTLGELLSGGRITLGMLQRGYYHCFAFYGPLNRAVEYKDMFEDTAEEYGFNPEVDSSFIAFPTAPWHGQQTYFEGEILTIDPTIPDQRKSIVEYSNRCVEKLLDIGFYGWFRPYADVLDFTLERWGTTGEFLKKLKLMVDPSNIMNPGRFIY